MHAGDWGGSLAINFSANIGEFGIDASEFFQLGSHADIYNLFQLH